MATKDIIYKKRLIKDSIVIIVGLIVLAGGGFMLSGYDDDMQTQKHTKEGESTSMRSEHDSIKQELGTGFEVNTFYNAYIRNHDENLLLDREAATKLMNVLREKNHLTNLEVTISPVSDVVPPFIPLKSGVMTKSEVHMSFSAVTDSSVYGFLEALERALPGIVVVKELKLDRTGDLSATTVRELSQHTITPLMNGELSFIWLGVRPTDEEKAETSFTTAGGHDAPH